MSIIKLKTNQSCSKCGKTLEIGTTIWIKRLQYGRRFEFTDLECALKSLKQRRLENIAAEAPKIIIDDFDKMIKELKTTIEAKNGKIV